MSENTDVSLSCWQSENDLTRRAQIAQQTEQQREEQKESTSEPAVSDFESEPDDESKHPEFRAHTTRKDEMKAAKFKPLYKVGRNVYLQGSGRSLKGMPSRGFFRTRMTLQGPYSIANVNSDGTYLLNDESGKPFKNRVRERDLRPV
jgi:hypothetical protein